MGTTRQRVPVFTNSVALQAKCACGQTATNSGSCSECDRKKQMQRFPDQSRPAQRTGQREPLIVEDDAEPTGPGQMRKSDFLASLKTAACGAADRALEESGRSTDGCPYIARWLDHYADQSAAHVERAVTKYAPDAANATTASEAIEIVAARASRAASRWADSGDLSDVPPELLEGMNAGSLLGAAVGGIGGLFSSALGAVGGALGGALGLSMKRDTGPERGAESSVDSIRGRLGTGQPLDARARSRMESAFGYDFSSVRVHADVRAEQATTSIGARAFTIGKDVAFAQNQYAPGTPEGDALLAHELAHVRQQSRGAITSDDRGLENPGLEADADLSAMGAVARLWSAAGAGAPNTPAMHSGLRLQRCGESYEPKSFAELVALTPWELGHVPDSWFANIPKGKDNEGRTLEDYARAARVIRCQIKWANLKEDPDKAGVLGEEPDDDQWNLIRGLIPSLLKQTKRTDTADLRKKIRVAEPRDFGVKYYQLQNFLTPISGAAQSSGDRGLTAVWWGTRCPDANPATGAIPTRHERSMSLIADNSSPGEKGGFYLPKDDVVYIDDVTAKGLGAAGPMGAERRTTTAHEVGHLLGSRTKGQEAFKKHFADDPQWICYWLLFEEGMAEIQAREAAGTETATRGYQNYVDVMKMIMDELGSSKVRAAFFNGEPFPELYDRIKALRPGHGDGSQPPACASLDPPKGDEK